MSKSLLVIDTPETCLDCPLHEWDDDGEWHGCSVSIYFRGLFNNTVNKNEKPDWCPLRPLPNRLPTFEPTTFYELSNLFHDGFNACLELITGETE